MTSVTNKVQLMGHLGQEPMIKQFSTGSKMASFSLATNESYTSASGTKIENTQWHRLVAWGTKRYTTEIVVNEFELMQTEKLLAA